MPDLRLDTHMEMLNLEPLKSITDGDPEWELELIEQLQEDCEELLAEMKESFHKDIGAFGAAAHKFKGSILYVADDPMADLISELDKRARRDEKFPTEEEFSNLQSYFGTIKKSLVEYVASIS